MIARERVRTTQVFAQSGTSQMAYDELLNRREAVERLLELRDSLATDEGEDVTLEAINGRILRRDIVATSNYPSHSFATMDGFAVDATADYPFGIAGEIFPDDEPSELGPGEAARIATGAPLPEGANAVLKQEDAVVHGGQITGPATTVGTYVYQRGSNIKAGETVLQAGEKLHPGHAIVLADLGYETVSVRHGHAVGILATGSEIHDGTSTDLDSPMLSGLISGWGHRPTYCGTVPDEFETVRDRIEELAIEYDVVVTTGGTSVGNKDHVIQALDELGTILFHGVRIRPGKPIGVAQLDVHDAICIAIPGKPIGAFTAALGVCRPFFTGPRRTGGFDATLARAITMPRPGFEYWIPVTLESSGDQSIAMPLGHVDSTLQIYEDTFSPSVLSSSTKAVCADGVLITESALEKDEPVTVVPYEEFT